MLNKSEYNFLTLEPVITLNFPKLPGKNDKENISDIFFIQLPQTNVDNYPRLSLKTSLEYLTQVSQTILTISNSTRYLKTTILDNYPRPAERNG